MKRAEEIAQKKTKEIERLFQEQQKQINFLLEQLKATTNTTTTANNNTSVSTNTSVIVTRNANVGSTVTSIDAGTDANNNANITRKDADLPENNDVIDSNDKTDKRDNVNIENNDNNDDFGNDNDLYDDDNNNNYNNDKDDISPGKNCSYNTTLAVTTLLDLKENANANTNPTTANTTTTTKQSLQYKSIFASPATIPDKNNNANGTTTTPESIRKRRRKFSGIKSPSINDNTELDDDDDDHDDHGKKNVKKKDTKKDPFKFSSSPDGTTYHDNNNEDVWDSQYGVDSVTMNNNVTDNNNDDDEINGIDEWDIPLSLTLDDCRQFNKCWKTLTSKGWYWIKGSNLVSFYYCRPTSATIGSNKKRTPEGEEGLNYFVDESKVIEFVKSKILLRPLYNNRNVSTPKSATNSNCNTGNHGTRSSNSKRKAVDNDDVPWVDLWYSLVEMGWWSVEGTSVDNYFIRPHNVYDADPDGPYPFHAKDAGVYWFASEDDVRIFIKDTNYLDVNSSNNTSPDAKSKPSKFSKQKKVKTVVIASKKKSDSDGGSAKKRKKSYNTRDNRGKNRNDSQHIYYNDNDDDYDDIEADYDDDEFEDIDGKNNSRKSGIASPSTSPKNTISHTFQPIKSSTSIATNNKSGSMKMANSKLFEKYIFIITAVDLDLKTNLVNNIKGQGGTVEDKTIDRSILDRGLTPILLSRPQGFRRENYLKAVAMGLTLVHYSWINDSLLRKCLLDVSDYLLPAGFSLLCPFYKFPNTSKNTNKPTGFLHGKVMSNVTGLDMWTSILELCGAACSASKNRNFHYTISENCIKDAYRGRIVTSEWLVHCLHEQTIIDFEANIIFTPSDNKSPHSFRLDSNTGRYCLFDIIRMKDNTLGQIKSFNDNNVVISIINVVSGKYIHQFSGDERLYNKNQIKSRIVIISDDKKHLKYISSDDDIFISTNDWETSWHTEKHSDDSNDYEMIRQASQDY